MMTLNSADKQWIRDHFVAKPVAGPVAQPPIVPPAPPQTNIPFTVTAPISGGLPTQPVAGIYQLDDMSDRVLTASIQTGNEHGLMVNNGNTARRIASDGVQCLLVKEYGFYGGGVFDHHHKNLTLSQEPGANQAMVRLAGDLVILENADLDNWGAVNDLLRLYGYTDDVTNPSRYWLKNCTGRGGILHFGVPIANDSDPNYPKNPVKVWITGGSYEYRGQLLNPATGKKEGYMVAVAGARRLAELHIDGTAFKGDSRFLDIDDPTNVTIHNVSMNGVMLRQSDVGGKIQGATQNVSVT